MLLCSAETIVQFHSALAFIMPCEFGPMKEMSSAPKL